MDICDWLRAFLRNGPRDVAEVRLAARVAGYTRGELRDAKRLCCIETTNDWTDEKPFITRWFWALPEEDRC